MFQVIVSVHSILELGLTLTIIPTQTIVVYEFHCLNVFFCVFLSPIAYLVDQVHFIGSPLVDTDYATPGGGNVSSDGVHPSTQGCKCFDCVWTAFVFISCIYVTIFDAGIYF